MHKKRQAQTRTRGKRPYRYKGLTQFEASARAKKAWQTRRARYGRRKKFAAYDPEGQDESFIPVNPKSRAHRRAAEESLRQMYSERATSARARRKRGGEGDDEMDWLEASSHRSSADLQKEALREEADLYAKSGRFQDPETAAFIRDLDTKQRSEFMRRVQSQREVDEYAAKLKKHSATKDIDETDLEYRESHPRLNELKSAGAKAIAGHEGGELAYQRALGGLPPLSKESKEELKQFEQLLAMTKDARFKGVQNEVSIKADRTLSRIVTREEKLAKDRKAESDARKLYQNLAKEEAAAFIAESRSGGARKAAARKVATDEDGNTVIVGGPQRKWTSKLDKPPGYISDEQAKEAGFYFMPAATKREMILQGQREKPIVDPRLAHATTVESLYEAYSAKRPYRTPPATKGEALERKAKRRLNPLSDQARLELQQLQMKGLLPFDYKGIDESEFHLERGDKMQGKFVYRPGAIQKGGFTRFYGDDHQLVSDKKNVFGKAAYGVIPQERWQYTLREAPSMGTEMSSAGVRRAFRRHPDDLVYSKTVEPWDVNTVFHVGKRDRYGRMLPGEYDQIVDAHYVPRSTRKVFSEFGERGLKDRPPLDETTEKEVFVEKTGLKKGEEESVLLRQKGETTWPEHFIRSGRSEGDESLGGSLGLSKGQWIPATKEEYDAAPSSDREVKYHKKDVKVTYVAPGTTELLKNQRDVAMVNLPPIKVKGQTLVGKHAVFAGINENNDSIYAQALRYGYLEPERVRQRWAREDKDEARLKTESAVKTLGVASFTSAGYAIQKRAKQRSLVKTDNAFGRGINSLGGLFGHPTLADDLSLHFGPHKEVAAQNIENKLGTKRELKFKARHPLMSAEGAAPQFYMRKRGIFPHTRHARQLEADVASMNRMNRVVEANLQGSRKSGLRGAFRRWRQEGVMENRNYNVYDKKIFAKSLDRIKPIEEAASRNADNVILPSPFKVGGEEVTLTNKLVQSAHDARRGAFEAKKKDFALSRAVVHSSGHGPVFPRAARWKSGQVTGAEGVALAAGAVIVTAAGAGYLYHRHQNKKREEAGLQKIALYNKVLPPAFKTPVPVPTRKGLRDPQDAFEAVVPGWQTTKRYVVPNNAATSMFMIDGNKIPVAGQVNMDRKKIAFRPVDRGYPADAGVGIPKIRGRAPGPGGVFNFKADIDRSMAASRGKKTYQPPGKDLYVAGRRTPFFVDIGKEQKVKLKASNKNKLTDSERESIVAAFAGTSEEARVRQFYSTGQRDKIVDLFDDPEFVRNAKHKKGVAEAEKFYKVTVKTPGMPDKVYKQHARELAKSYVKSGDDSGERDFGGIDFRHLGTERDRGGQRRSHEMFYDQDWLHVDPPNREAVKAKAHKKAIEGRLGVAARVTGQAHPSEENIKGFNKLFTEGIDAAQAELKKATPRATGPRGVTHRGTGGTASGDSGRAKRELNPWQKGYRVYRKTK